MSFGELYSFALIGCGPAANFLFKQFLTDFKKNFFFHFFERNFFPFGLVRDGMAPDHQSAKKIELMFKNNLKKNIDKFEYFGNCNVGLNKIKKLLPMYSAVILANGAQEERKLRIPGENLEGVYSASEISNWYNGSMTSKAISFNEKSNNLVIIGNGNVALDILRILTLRSLTELRPLDIPLSRLTEIEKLQSKIKNVYLIARRGIQHSAFDTKNLREISKLAKEKNVNIFISRRDLEEGEQLVRKIPELRRKFSILKTFRCFESPFPRGVGKGGKNIFFVYNHSPMEIAWSPVGCSVIRLRNSRENKVEQINNGMIIKSIGRRVSEEQLDFLKRNENVFSVGWASTNGKGKIASTRENVMSVFEGLSELINRKKIIKKKIATREMIRGIFSGGQVTSFEDYLKLDEYERERGRALQKIREKIIYKEGVVKIIK